MAREYAKRNMTIWQDPEWRALPWPAQHAYNLFWDHPKLSYCGVVDWRPAKMLGSGAGWRRSDFNALVACLQARHFLVIDEDTEECLVRSWVRFDGLMRQPRLAVSMSLAYAEVGSNTIRGVIIDELVKLQEREPEALGWNKPQVQSMLDLPRISAKDLAVPEDPFASDFEVSLGSVSEAFGGNPTSGLGSGFPTPYNSNSNSNVSTATSEIGEPTPDQHRDDVERICDHLAASVERRGSKRPNVTKKWRDAARLMLDRDGYTEAQVSWLIDKTEADDFWSSNVLSMPKLREKAGQLTIKFRGSNVRHLARTDEQGQLVLPPLPPRTPWGNA